MRLVAGLLLGACCTAAVAAEVDALTIEHADRRYRMHLAARLDTPLQASFRAFSNFDNLPRINDAVEVVQRMDGAAAGSQRIYTRVRVCVWFFCAHLDQVQDIAEVSNGPALGLDAVVIPQLSNLRFGTARWRMRDCAPQTCLEFDAELEPDFWVPPIIGPWAIERAMRGEAVGTAYGIERIAEEESGA